MTPLLAQFLTESREFLQRIGDLLLQLERSPADGEVLNDLFRSVHTLKGNSGLFDFPDMTRVLHAAEDLMVAVRDGRLGYSQSLADALLDAMDFIVALCDQINQTQSLGPDYVVTANHHVQQLRAFIPGGASENSAVPNTSITNPELAAAEAIKHSAFLTANLFSRKTRQQAFVWLTEKSPVVWVCYTPIAECFFQGDDPVHLVCQLPAVKARLIRPLKPWSGLGDMDIFQSNLQFQLLSCADQDSLIEHLRFVPDQYQLQVLTLADCAAPDFFTLNAAEQSRVQHIVGFLTNESNPRDSASLRAQFNGHHPSHAWLGLLDWIEFWLQRSTDDPTQVVQWLLATCKLCHFPWIINPAEDTETIEQTASLTCEGIAEEDQAALLIILQNQRHILALQEPVDWFLGRFNAAIQVLRSCCLALNHQQALTQLAEVAQAARETAALNPLLEWIDRFAAWVATLHPQIPLGISAPAPPVASELKNTQAAAAVTLAAIRAPANLAEPISVGAPVSAVDINQDEARLIKRGDEPTRLPSLKVDQSKIDRLMNLIGELIVAKNGLPYLANRAEEIFGVRELGREIKSHHGVINRIAEEMQDAIMQIRMMPFSVISSRYPRLVRDIARKLTKDVQFIIEGEDTEADKNIIESLADPLVHILRNSLDHGIESAEERQRAGKPAQATLRLKASQEADRVVILVSDDGRGIDPDKIKRKAYEKGLIDETALERLSEREAIHLIFAAGFSTAEVVSDLSGRGVGMDVVRTAVEKVNGTIAIDSQVGKGTRISIALPLSMAVTRVMLIEADQQLFAIPMDEVVETVRVAKSQIHTIKQHQTTLLRGRIVPLCQLHRLLELTAQPMANSDDEWAVLVVRIGDEVVGLVVDNFHGTVDVIQKPLEGVLANLPAYSGSALLGDGSVLMVLNIKALLL